jgi:uncharacterized membrane protein YozB (DUF420 family)
MISAFVVSCVFWRPTWYTTIESGMCRLPEGLDPAGVFVLLTSHVILAFVIVPLILITLPRVDGAFDKHRAIAVGRCRCGSMSA